MATLLDLNVLPSCNQRQRNGRDRRDGWHIGLFFDAASDHGGPLQLHGPGRRHVSLDAGSVPQLYLCSPCHIALDQRL